MKRFILGILSILYLNMACGVVISIHYCMGKGTDVSYHFQENEKCPRCGMKDRKGCCHTEFKIVKISDDQQQAKTTLAIAQMSPPCLDHLYGSFPNCQGGEKWLSETPHAPSPPGSPVPSYLLHRVFRI